MKSHSDCIATASAHPRQRKKRFPEAILLARIRRYEEVLKSYGADIDAIRGDDGAVDLKAGKGASGSTMLVS